MARSGIYVETTIAADLEQVWRLSQEPSAHARWDLRFSSIVPEPEPEPEPAPEPAPGQASVRPTQRVVEGETADAAARRFTYTRRVPFHTVHGIGVSLGETDRPDGSRTSALRFSTDDRLSPLRSGRGYWRYTTDAAGTRFITGYDYEPGWGPLDVVVRPLLGWATAWSFDRLRIWIERGEEPEHWPLRSALWFWRGDRPRAGRCRRAPAGGIRRADHLAGAPSTLATLPEPAATARIAVNGVDS
ncbi:SRPBCC family protein [Agromyces sp. PvR057]|uniref:SRPBCC family protein n=1 Tax=Agromyces sp. PvR057 TaxID=3156403 RepID=UPI0033928C51